MSLKSDQPDFVDRYSGNSTGRLPPALVAFRHKLSACWRCADDDWPTREPNGVAARLLVTGGWSHQRLVLCCPSFNVRHTTLAQTFLHFAALLQSPSHDRLATLVSPVARLTDINYHPPHCCGLEQARLGQTCQTSLGHETPHRQQATSRLPRRASLPDQPVHILTGSLTIIVRCIFCLSSLQFCHHGAGFSTAGLAERGPAEATGRQCHSRYPGKEAGSRDRLFYPYDGGWNTSEHFGEGVQRCVNCVPWSLSRGRSLRPRALQFQCERDRATELMTWQMCKPLL